MNKTKVDKILKDINFIERGFQANFKLTNELEEKIKELEKE